MHLPTRANVIFPQWIAGIGVTLLLIHIGIMGGWSSPTLVRLAGTLTPSQASWVVSVLNLTRLFGGILGPVLANFLGSKCCIFITLFPISIGWLVIVIASNFEWLLVSRLLSGLGLGMAYSVFPLYIGEVSMTEIRGALISVAIAGSPAGQVIASICGSYLSISESAAIYIALALLLLILFYWLPESPHHLVKIGKKDEARKSIDWYRDGRGVDKELQEVDDFVTANTSQSFGDKLSEFKTPAVRRATIQIIALYTFMQLCGLNCIIFYMETILMKAKFTLITASSVVIYVNVCSTFASVGSIFLIDRCGRKFLLLVGSAGLVTSMVMLMSHFLMIDQNVDVANLQWLPMSALFIYMISFFMSLMPVPSATLSETFPANIKCIAACVAGITGAITAFTSAKTYQPLVDLFGEAYVFLIYAIITVMIIPYTLFFMLETKGKSLQQIQDELMKKK